MTGQEAVSVAQTFNERVGATGLILTKMDGDARGGAALSIRAVTGVPIKFIGTGEKLDALEPFYPDRLAGRILGMGDILSLIERAQETTTEEDAVELQERMLKGQFNLEDFLEQLQKVKQMGPLSQLLEMIPGLGAQMRQAKAQISDDDYKRVEAIIYSMTPDERRNPDVIGRRRTARIAKGSGTSIQEVKQLLKQFEEMQKMMSQMGRMAKKGKMPRGSALQLRVGEPARSAKSSCKAASGSAANPAWTGPGCTTVLAGAESQPNRSAAGKSAIAPPAGSPATTSRITSSCRATASRSSSGQSARRRSTSSRACTPRNLRGREKSTTPTLTNSSRSTRGTTRMVA